MKNLLLPLLLVVSYLTSAQVGIGTTTPDASAAIEISSTTAGMLIPRMTETQKNAIGSPATGLLIYQTNNTPDFYYYNGTIWTTFGGADNDWTVVGNDMYNANTGNVGVGNTTPSAKFHITGTTTPSSSGGTVNLLNENFTGYTVIQNFTADASCTTTTGWQTSSSAPASYDCTSCTGDYLYIDADDSSCDQNATVLMSFTPTNNSVDISFDYLIREYSSGSDSFRAYLHDGTSQVGADLVSINTGSSTTTDSSFSGSGIAVIASTTYSLRFEYIGSFAYGATVDNVLVTETGVATAGSYVFRLEDGQEQAGYVLTSDANGNASWAAGGAGSNQTLSISGSNLTISGGNTVTLPSGGGGTDDQTVDVFSLTGTTLNLSLENDGMATQTVDLSGLVGSSSYTFTNGLTESSGTVRLGGNLTQSTYITLGSNDLYFEGTGTGDITFEDNSGQPQMTTNFSEGFTNFGSGGAFVDSDDGSTFSDTYSGGPFTKEFVLGAYNGTSGGTAIALGSIEYVVDGTNELFYEGGGFSPMTDFGADLGANPFTGVTRRWDDVNADDFVTPTNTYSRTSSRSSNNRDLEKGLDEILKLKPIVYKDNMAYVNGKRIPDNLREDKLGFYTEELLRVLPEAVKKSDWVSLDESGKKTRVVYDKPSGIKFTQIIPVTVKAIQEQQEQIEVLKSEISELKELVNKLISEKK
ncbi:MAG: hypothetical protein HRT69_16780 [Flavobacteriaceae bacterium]|nr:hypothetical protein [Flavobacteriaceae bacterium]